MPEACGTLYHDSGIRPASQHEGAQRWLNLVDLLAPSWPALGSDSAWPRQGKATIHGGEQRRVARLPLWLNTWLMPCWRWAPSEPGHQVRCVPPHLPSHCCPPPGPCSDLRGKERAGQLVMPSVSFGRFPGPDSSFVYGPGWGWAQASGSQTVSLCSVLSCHFLSSKGQPFPPVPLPAGPESPGE